MNNLQCQCGVLHTAHRALALLSVSDLIHVFQMDCYLQ